MVRLLINHPKFDSINEKSEDGKTALHLGKYLNVFKSIVFYFIIQSINVCA